MQVTIGRILGPVTVADYRAALDLARQQSIERDGAVHLNATVGVVEGRPTVVALRTSDWYIEGSTVVTFVDGEQRS